MNSKLFVIFGLVLMLVIAGCISETDAEKTAKKKAKEAPKEEKGKAPSPTPSPKPLPAPAPQPTPSPQPQPQPSPTPAPQPAPQAAPALPQRSGTYTLRTLIAEVSDRQVLDRWGPGIYSLAGSDTAADAHPFANGLGGGLSGVSNEELFKIDGLSFPAFADIALTDPVTNTQYTEKQYIFLQSHNQYRDSMDAVGGRFKDFVYQIKFEPAIPYDSRTHNIRVKFLNNDFTITGLDAPDSQVQEGQVVSGGQVYLRSGSNNALTLLTDGQVFEGWRVRLTWKKGPQSNNADHLRSIILYKDLSDYFTVGQGYNIGGSNRFTFKFTGLDKNPSSSADYDTLRYEFVDTGASFSYVADGSTATTRESNSSYVKITCGSANCFSTNAGSGNEFRVLLLTNGNAALTSSITRGASSGFASRSTLYPGDIILKLDGAPERWVYVGTFNTGGSVEIDYPTAGASRNMESGGALRVGWGGVPGWSVNGVEFASTQSAATNIGNTGGVVILLSEDAGEEQSANKPDAVATFFNITTKSFNKDSPNGRYIKDKCTVASVSAFARTVATYDLEGAVNMPTQREINYVTHRGTVCKEISDNLIILKVPKQVVHAEFELRAE
ncbi:hypothetical protein J4450_06015 [Candidatus Micrarchaeota archaeon]|nr:hypothetical protein [Candidatus Micrarchaeota archaeon]